MRVQEYQIVARHAEWDKVSNWGCVQCVRLKDCWSLPVSRGAMLGKTFDAVHETSRNRAFTRVVD